MSRNLSVKVGISTMLLPQKELAEAVEELLQISQGRIRHFELLCEGTKNHPESLTESQIRRLRAMASRDGITYSMHGPCYEINPASHNPGARREAVRQYKACIELAERFGIGDLVVHAGQCSSGLEPKAEAKGYCIESLGECMEYAKARGVSLLVENTGLGYGRFLETPGEFLSVVKAIGSHGNVRALLDTGHAAVMGWDLRDSVAVLKDSLGQIHFHDNGGNADEHMPPGKGSLDLKGVLRDILSLGWSGILLLEIFDADPIGGLSASICHLESSGVLF